MEASFVDIGESRNGVLYAGEVGIAGDEGDEVPIETVLPPRPADPRAGDQGPDARQGGG